MSNSIRDNIMDAGDVENSNPLGPRNVDAETSRPKLQTVMASSSLRPPQQDKKIERKAAPTKETVHLDICLPFIRCKLVDHTVPTPSSYIPSAHMMYYVLHCMDNLMTQNHHFMQNNVVYHPLVTRIYYGTLFYIQILRCMNHVKVLDREGTAFLKTFLESYPPESLSIAGPLATIFQSLTCSSARFIYQGKIYPTIRDFNSRIIGVKVKDSRENAFFLDEDVNSGLPSLAMLHGFLNSLTSPEMKTLVGSTDYPKQWHPFMPIPTGGANNERSAPRFLGHLPADLTAWSTEERWSLARPGLMYPLETTKEQNERFTTYGDRLLIPTLSFNPGNVDLEDYMNLGELRWFGEVMAIATAHAKYFKQPTTLDKCSVEGPGTAQVIITYADTPRSVPSPTKPGDTASQVPLVFRARSSNPELTDTEQLMAFTAQLNVDMPTNHPRFKKINRTEETMTREGQFWDIKPECMEAELSTGFYQVKDVIQDHFYLDKPKF